MCFLILDRSMLVQLLELWEGEQRPNLDGFWDRTACILQEVHERGLQKESIKVIVPNIFGC